MPRDKSKTPLLMYRGKRVGALSASNARVGVSRGLGVAPPEDWGVGSASRSADVDMMASKCARTMGCFSLVDSTLSDTSSLSRPSALAPGASTSTIGVGEISGWDDESVHLPYQLQIGNRRPALFQPGYRKRRSTRGVKGVARGRPATTGQSTEHCWNLSRLRERSSLKINGANAVSPVQQLSKSGAMGSNLGGTAVLFSEPRGHEKLDVELLSVTKKTPRLHATHGSPRPHHERRRIRTSPKGENISALLPGCRNLARRCPVGNNASTFFH